MAESVAVNKDNVRICVLIPTYNNGQTLAQVISDVLEYTGDIIVVNDGSTDQTSTILKQFPGVEVLNHEVNCGKGLALRNGFERALALNYTHAISIDSDGQHYADDLPKFFDAAMSSPDALVIGVRNMDQHSVPGKSSFGHKFSNFWYWVETGLRRNDTQSGYRLYPLIPLKGHRWYTRKFEFEIEVIVRAAWSGIPMHEVPVKVFYADPSVRISHFRPFKDFTRISILNTVLVTIAIVYIKPRDFFRSLQKKNFREILREQLSGAGQSNRTIASSIGFGLFMGIVPLWGLQLAIAIPLSILMRMNTVLVVLFAHISIPPMIPVILFLSHYTGQIWMGENRQLISFSMDITMETVRTNFIQYFLGAFTLAVAIGLTFGLLAFLLMRLRRRSVS